MNYVLAGEFVEAASNQVVTSFAKEFYQSGSAAAVGASVVGAFAGESLIPDPNAGRFDAFQKSAECLFAEIDKIKVQIAELEKDVNANFGLIVAAKTTEIEQIANRMSSFQRGSFVCALHLACNLTKDQRASWMAQIIESVGGEGQCDHNDVSRKSSKGCSYERFLLTFGDENLNLLQDDLKTVYKSTEDLWNSIGIIENVRRDAPN